MVKKGRLTKAFVLIMVLALMIPSVFAMNPSSLAESAVGQRALEHIEYLSQEIGPRIAGQASEIAGRDYIVDVFEGIGYSPEIQPFSFVRGGNTVNSNNVIAIKPGESSQQIIVGAHYDSVTSGGSLGADDNASGVGVMLEVAEKIKNIDTSYTIKFIAFGAEEVGLRGARYSVESMSQEEIDNTIAMINLDSVLSGDMMYVYNGLEQVTWVREQAQEIAANLGLDLQTNPGLNPSYPYGTAGDWSDHAPFRQAGIPIAYFEATNWEIGALDGYTQTEEYGPIIHTGRDNLDFIRNAFPGRIEERLDTFTTALFHLLLEISPPTEIEQVELSGAVANKNSWNLNATIPFKFTALNEQGNSTAMEDITVRVFGRNEELAVFTEGKGANFVRQQGKSGDYMVNINSRHLGLSQGAYTILVEFNNNGQRVVHSTPIILK